MNITITIDQIDDRWVARISAYPGVEAEGATLEEALHAVSDRFAEEISDREDEALSKLADEDEDATDVIPWEEAKKLFR